MAGKGGIIPDIFGERMVFPDGSHADCFLGDSAQMADGAKSEPDLVPVTASTKGEPASGEVALAGKDGHALNSVIRNAKEYGVRRVAEVVNQAASRYTGSGQILNKEELHEVAQAIAAVNATAELLGRARVRELQARAGDTDAGDDQPFRKFADNPPSEIRTPENALDYFLSLAPKIGVNPERFANEQRRRAFTLAAALDDNLTKDIQSRIASALKEHKGTADATASLQQALDLAGVTRDNPQYSEMVFRTNAMDAYQTGAWEEAQSPDLEEMFPCWQYLGIRDGRQGPDHEPHFDKYYPRARAFADVRGERVYNCRCSLRWVDKFEWAKLQSHGTKEEG